MSKRYAKDNQHRQTHATPSSASRMLTCRLRLLRGLILAVVWLRRASTGLPGKHRITQTPGTGSFSSANTFCCLDQSRADWNRAIHCSSYCEYLHHVLLARILQTLLCCRMGQFRYILVHKSDILNQAYSSKMN